jgi:hypothetical protein
MERTISPQHGMTFCLKFFNGVPYSQEGISILKVAFSLPANFVLSILENLLESAMDASLRTLNIQKT